jgi:transcriptional regulator with XRE-family HTH domain
MPRGRRPPPAELGARLRRLREKAGLSAAVLASRLGWAESTLTRKESGKIGITEDQLHKVLDSLGVSNRDRTGVLDLVPADHGSARQTRTTRPGALPKVYARYLALEEVATEIWIYATMIVPGLLQTPDYAAAIIQQTPVPEDDLVHDRMVTRLGRQAVLGRQPPPRIRVVLDESVLVRRIGDRATMRRQMLRLVEARELATTTIQVLELDHGTHPALVGGFTVLQFESESIRSHVFCDSLVGGVLNANSEDFQRYRACFEALAREASDQRRSLELIEAAAKRTYTHTRGKGHE